MIHTSKLSVKNTLKRTSHSKSTSHYSKSIFNNFHRALILLNVHAHLSKNEVIGYLGGVQVVTKDSKRGK